MSTPLIWILFPGVLGLLLFFLRSLERIVVWVGVVSALMLAFAAWQLPIGVPLSLFSNLSIQDTWFVLGRRFVLAENDRQILVLIYLGLALWFGGAFVAKAGRLFVPLGLIASALLIAALAVDPVLYAALLIEMAALVCAPILSPPRKPVGRGTLRFITFQTLGMPLILFTSWIIPTAQANPQNSSTIAILSLLLLLGFALLLAVLPFHVWLPMVSMESNPYSVAFIFSILMSTISILALTFLIQYNWLRIPLVFSALRLLGVLMVIVGGIWAAMEKHLGRMMGYAMIFLIGVSLLAVSLGASGIAAAPAEQSGGALPPLIGVLLAMFIPIGICLAIWSQGLCAIRAETGDLHFSAVRGVAYRLPLASSSVLIAILAVAGFPFLAFFPAYIALWSSLARADLLISLVALVGLAGLAVASLRAASLMLTDPASTTWLVSENRWQAVILVLGILLIIVLGSLPQLYIPLLASANPF